MELISFRSFNSGFNKKGKGNHQHIRPLEREDGLPIRLNQIYPVELLLTVKPLLEIMNLFMNPSTTIGLPLTLTFAGGIKLSMPYYVYILKCSDGQYYYGYTSDLNSRLVLHRQGSGYEEPCITAN